MPYKDLEKRKNYSKENYAKNRERLKAIRHAWYLANKEKIAAKAKERFAIRKARFNERKPEINARRRERYAKDTEYRDKIKARSRVRV